MWIGGEGSPPFFWRRRLVGRRSEDVVEISKDLNTGTRQVRRRARDVEHECLVVGELH